MGIGELVGYILAFAFKITFSVIAAGLIPTAFSANTANVYSDFSRKLSSVYCRQVESKVTTLLHFVEMDCFFSITYPGRAKIKFECLLRRQNFQMHLPVISEPPVLAGGNHSSVTLRLVTLSTVRFCGGEGAAAKNQCVIRNSQ